VQRIEVRGAAEGRTRDERQSPPGRLPPLSSENAAPVTQVKEKSGIFIAVERRVGALHRAIYSRSNDWLELHTCVR
jgi:hypothetical protein